MVFIKNKLKVVTSFTLVFILIGLGFVFLPLLFGYKLHFVVSDSMSPTVNKGDLVITKIVSPTQISSGDIILFESKSNQHNTLILHRVQEKHSNKNVIYFTTKGDSNKYNDFQTASASKVNGLYVYHIPRIGWLIDFIKDYQFYITILLVVSFLFINVPRLTYKSGERHEA